jgi:2-keto-4-pentenoate hydratase/2-oxohepta-3-ene-1,7-dioic acid hydratase in catechol pathway
VVVTAVAVAVARGRIWHNGPSYIDAKGGVGMRLATIRTGEREEAAVVTSAGVLPLGTDLLSLLENERLDELDNVVENRAGDALPMDQLEYAPPYRRPRKIWGIGLNYAEHAGDLDERPPTDEPASFMRPDTTIIGPSDEILLPEQSARVTAEAELGLVIGRAAKNVSEEEAPAVVAGFTTVLDMTAEDILRKNPRYLTRAKSFDTFFSFGPQLLTPDEVGEIAELEVVTVLNGEVRRSNTVSNMTFSPWYLVSFHSKVMTLLPGDIISTGTPGAVEIKDGDVVECRIGEFEPLSNPVRRT